MSDLVPITESESETSDEITALAKELQELRSLIDEQKSAVAEFDPALQEIASERQRLNEQAQALALRESEIKTKAWDFKQKLRDAEKLLDSRSRQFEQALKVKSAKEEFLALEKRWDALCLNNPWQEFVADHQVTIAKRMATAAINPERLKCGFINADAMGLGKTLSAIVTCDILAGYGKFNVEHKTYKGFNYTTNESEFNVEVKEYHLGKRVLYITQAACVNGVVREFKKWSPKRTVLPLTGYTKAARRFVLENCRELTDYVVVGNYEMWRKDKALLTDLSDTPFDVLIIDEAHNIKELDTAAYKGIKHIVDMNDNIKAVFPMTGTPILNRPQEIYPLLHLIDGKQFHSLPTFLNDYCEMDYYTKRWHFQPGGMERLGKKIGNVYLRRTKQSAGIKLPDKTVNFIDIEWDHEHYPEQWAAYESFRKFAYLKLSEEKYIGVAAEIALYTRLRQMITWPAGIVLRDENKVVTAQVDVHESVIIDEAMSLLPEALGIGGPDEERERAVVFSQFNEPLYEMERRCTRLGISAVVFNAHTPDNTREQIKLSFDAGIVEGDPDWEKKQACPKWDVVLCNWKAGGIGLNFTEASQMIVLDEEWNPGKNEQGYDRLHRMGQQKPVTINVLRVPGTITTWLANLNAEKAGMIEGFNQEMDTRASFLEAVERGEV